MPTASPVMVGQLLNENSQPGEGYPITHPNAHGHEDSHKIKTAIRSIGGELYESVGVEAPILLSYTHKKEWNTHGGLPTRCQRSAMGVSSIFVGVRQQNGCFDTHTFIQLSTYGPVGVHFGPIFPYSHSCHGFVKGLITMMGSYPKTITNLSYVVALRYGLCQLWYFPKTVLF